MWYLDGSFGVEGLSWILNSLYFPFILLGGIQIGIVLMFAAFLSFVYRVLILGIFCWWPIVWMQWNGLSRVWCCSWVAGDVWQYREIVLWITVFSGGWWLLIVWSGLVELDGIARGFCNRVGYIWYGDIAYYNIYWWVHGHTMWGLAVENVDCCASVHVCHFEMCYWWGPHDIIGDHLGRGKIVLGTSLFDKLKYRIALHCCTFIESFLFITHNGVEAKFVFALLN